MLFRASLVCMVASLVCAPLATALPTERARSDMALTARDDTQCPAGKAFYVCALNNFRGCCSVDPCALKEGCPDKTGGTTPPPVSCPETGTTNPPGVSCTDPGTKNPEKPKDTTKNETKPPSNSCPAPETDTNPNPPKKPTDEPTDKPSTSPKKNPTCPPSGKKTKLFQPLTQTLIPNSSPVPTTNFNVSKTATTDQQQLISWKLPATAKSCIIGWAVPLKRNFKAGGNASVDVYVGSDKNNNKRVGNANFAFWPERDEARSNLVAVVECKEDMLFRLKMEHEDSVFLEQNEETGWWVEYEC
ncbi:uncharacterized protein LDX57_002614 [Aspergillus melleus]|uniref:uncharacterized protein n=1 Tax=Aspergillus melleus TaxID=138277 RepID=UPI001E8D00FD|nr:uncharacterized protein LDX57_002614 [Aspergillus melleus]KAH8424870.1 hypothetical protein LDX57_002614 [Aspergillus melleus]